MIEFKAQSRLIIVLVVLAALTLILINYYSSKIKSGVRSYINGESAYSKGQKDASLNLTYYLNTKDPSFWNSYKKSLKVPMSDNKARHSMMNNEPDSIAFNHFINGKVHSSDIGNIIWMFKNFRKVTEFKEAVNLWAKSEVLLLEVDKLAEQFKRNVDDEKLKQQLYKKIATSNLILTDQETNFSIALSNLARKIEKLLNWVNVLVTILIVGSLSSYLLFIIAKLYKSKSALKISYDKVFDLNLELDTFVYSLSHDLRAPLNSLQGLVQLSILETDVLAIKENMNLMDKLLKKQDLFIKDVISLLQRRDLNPQPIKFDLKALVEDAISLNKHNTDNKEMNTEIQIPKDLEEIYSDVVFIKIIINNLISNAFRYSDPTKENPFIKIKIQRDGANLVISIEDNGIGISNEFHEKVFEMFYILNANKRGTGLGLYIIKQSVEKLKGKIYLDSILGVGSRFTIILPIQQVQVL
ncbi:HAMP domain-containing sensor histidine kinase [Pedobacter sp. Du54]|uniref:sensor histidine kinase n=1 Tax=Pedobacter anseongensis TaxID=3133439 RepID=UPI0030AC5B06